MKVIDGDFLGKRVSIHKELFGKHVLEVNATNFRLPDDIAKLKVLHKEAGRSSGEMLWIIILAVTIIGLPFAIQRLLSPRVIGATIGIQTKGGNKFVFVADNSAWNILKNFVGIGDMDE